LLQIGFAQQASSVDKVSISVSDIDEAVAFYTQVLSFQHTGTYILEGKSIQRLFGIRDKKLKVEVASLQLGSEQIELMEFHSSKKGRESRTCFYCASNFTRLYSCCCWHRCFLFSGSR